MYFMSHDINWFTTAVDHVAMVNNSLTAVATVVAYYDAMVRSVQHAFIYICVFRAAFACKK